ncbi:TolB family protein [Aquimarina rhabdastrellae]
MIKEFYFTMLLVVAMFLNACHTNSQKTKTADIPSMEDRYFGEKPPGLTPKLFDPKIVSPEGSFEGGTFSPDMKEFYFTRKNGKYKKRTFFVIRYENNTWGKESETDIRWPQFSADGNTMYLGKEYKERMSTGWSESKSRGAFLKEQGHGISVSSNGTYYFPFFKKEDNGHGNLGYSRIANGKYENPVKLNAEINTGEYIAHPYIAPDESYLMWDVEREDGHGQSDIYISFKHKDGSWSTPINMGSLINTELQESSPHVTHDGKYLFFTRGEWKVNEDGSRNFIGKRYWVDSKIIETLRPDPNLLNIASTSYPIAYGSNGIFLTNIEGTSKVRLSSGAHGYPAWSPDGKQIAFYGKYDNKKTWSIHIMNSDGSNKKRLTNAKNKWDSMPSWSPDGKQIVFGREYKDSENVWQYEIWIMDADGSNQRQIKSLCGGGPSFTNDGRLLFHSEYKDKESEISIADVDGKNITHLTDNETEEWDPKISPDGKLIAYMSKSEGNREIYVMDIDGANKKRLTTNPGSDGGPCWSPDGTQIIFHSERKKDGKDDNGLYIMNKDGSSVRKLVANGWQPAGFKPLQ